MPAEFSEAEGEIDPFRDRAEALAARLQAAQHEIVTATSADGLVAASAAGRHLTDLSIDAAAKLDHQTLVAAMLDAAQAALRASGLVIAQAVSADNPGTP